MQDLNFSSARQLAQLIRERKLTSREVVELHIAQIERVNPTLNAVVATRFDEARREADLADERVRASLPAELPPLLGVPCTIKESFCVGGMPNAAGLVSRKGIVSTADATAVRRLRAAGAIPLGMTIRPSSACGWKPTTACTGVPTIPTIPSASSAGAPAERPRSSLPPARRSGSARTSGVRFAARASSTASSATNPPAVWYRTRGSIRSPTTKRGAFWPPAPWSEKRRTCFRSWKYWRVRTTKMAAAAAIFRSRTPR